VIDAPLRVRQQIRLTVIHELGHYFGLDEPTEGSFAKQFGGLGRVVPERSRVKTDADSSARREPLLR